ncbi:conserved hypothetical protein [Coccidioides posadasii str. Silveira]|uniref:Uncharacterized protein n=2 Tax=Coccidioides posadasii TaxID=199306 RepID=E9CVA7_COCPS|nr:conserved hypothetical protein [Coccidioides posadasii str. Silveira]KMM71652.1 hypothetical protein CPAG_07955 [Coccidioides posadasii RMSCC 3488]
MGPLRVLKLWHVDGSVCCGLLRSTVVESGNLHNAAKFRRPKKSVSFGRWFVLLTAKFSRHIRSIVACFTHVISSQSSGVYKILRVLVRLRKSYLLRPLQQCATFSRISTSIALVETLPTISSAFQQMGMADPGAAGAPTSGLLWLWANAEFASVNWHLHESQPLCSKDSYVAALIQLRKKAAH